jgi:hypothetical protein
MLLMPCIIMTMHKVFLCSPLHGHLMPRRPDKLAGQPELTIAGFDSTGQHTTRNSLRHTAQSRPLKPATRTQKLAVDRIGYLTQAP